MIQVRYSTLFTAVLFIGLLLSSCATVPAIQRENPTSLLVVEVGLEESLIFPLCSYLDGESLSVDPDGLRDPIGKVLCVDGAKEDEFPVVGEILLVRKVSWANDHSCYVVNWRDVVAVYKDKQELLRTLWCAAKK